MFSNPSMVLYAPGQAQVEDRPVPKLESSTDAIIRIGAVGVCGSDVHFWSHGGIGQAIIEKDRPIVMGHEAAGTVHEVGSAVTNIKPGDRVAVEPGLPCRTCDRCKEGTYHLCPDMKFAACPPNTPGTLSKYFKIAADLCYKLPDSISMAEGILAEPLAVAAHAVRMVGIKPGDRLVVFGAGTIGLLSAAVARYFGAKQVVAVDMVDAKLRFAMDINKCDTFKPDNSITAQQNAAKLLHHHNLGRGADAVIEATGAESCINTAICVLRPGGHMIQTGLGKSVVSFPIEEFSMKEIHMHGACRYGPGDFAVAMNILDAELIPVKKLISTTFPFHEATQAWEATKGGEGLKNVILGVED